MTEVSYESVVRLQFPLTGSIDVPLEHSEALYGALSRICPFVHESPYILISSIKGVYAAKNRLILADQGSFYLQSPVTQIPQILNIAGKSFAIGRQKQYIGIPKMHPLTPANELIARMVVVRGKQTEQELYDYLVGENLNRYGAAIDEDYRMCILRRRVLRLHGKQIFGFGVAITDIASETLSMQIQADPPGSRKKYGCSFFIPGRLVDHETKGNMPSQVVEIIET